MTILYHFRTRGTGAEAVHIAGIVRSFEKLGHDVVLSSPTGADPRRTAGASPFGDARPSLVSRITRRLPHFIFELIELLYNVPAFFRNLLLALANRPGLIFERHAFFLFSTALVARIAGCPLVVEVNELVGDERIRAQPLLAPLARWTDGFLFKHAALIVTVSHHLKRRVAEYGIPESRILVLPNAVSEAELAPPPPLPQPLVPDAPPGAFLLGFVGWLVEWHRLDFVIESLAVPDFASVILVLIGDGPLRPALEAQARSLGVKIHITGAMPHSAIPSALRALDACIVPHSNNYRSPIKLFECMAQERPVLAPATEPIQGVAEDGKEALLFTPLDRKSLREMLAMLLNNKGLRDSLGKSARTAVESRHTWEKNAENILKYIM
jgi:glycosyltransferase involved in cell wall biosynthesis